MPDIFQADIAGRIGRALGPKMLPATLIEVTPGQRSAGNLSGGRNPIETPHAARGFVDDYGDDQIDGTRIKKSDRIVTLFGATIENQKVPVADWKIQIEGSTYLIVRVKRDPAGATYECQARG